MYFSFKNFSYTGNASHESEIKEMVNTKIVGFATEVDRRGVEQCMLVIRDSPHFPIFSVDG
jgi:hypothetical protein